MSGIISRHGGANSNPTNGIQEQDDEISNPGKGTKGKDEAESKGEDVDKGKKDLSAANPKRHAAPPPAKIEGFENNDDALKMMAGDETKLGKYLFN